MSGFFNSNETSRWGGYLKQAISNVETTFDSLLEQNQPTGDKSSQNTETETYVDPISGMVTTVQRTKTIKPPQETKNRKINTKQTKIESQPSVDLSARLAAVMADRKARKTTTSQRIEEGISKENKEKEQSAEMKMDSVNNDKGKEVKLEEEKDLNSKKKKDVDSEEEQGVDSQQVQDADSKQVQDVDSKQVQDVGSTTNTEAEDMLKKSIENTTDLNTIDEEKIDRKINDDSQSTNIPCSVMTENKSVDDIPINIDGTLLNISIPPSNDTPQPNDNVPTTDSEAATAKEDMMSTDTIEKDKILEQREKQLLQSMENIALLHDQIHQLQEEAGQKESELNAEISSLRSQLNEKIEEGNSASSAISLQKSNKRLEATIDELKKQSTAKDEKIQGLLSEGEKLSKMELRHTTLIKKLRSEKAEQEKSMNDLLSKFEKLSTDLSKANEKGIKQSESEKRLQESVKLLSDLTEQQTKHINKLESEKIEIKERLQEKQKALAEALENTEQERDKARQEAEEINAIALEKEIKANERLHNELKKLQETSETMETKLRKEIRDLQIALQSAEEQAGVLEDALRKEVTDLQTRLQTADNRLEESTTLIEEATTPLLLQIKELQTQYMTALKNRDQLEQSMIHHTQAAENEQKRALDKEVKLQSEINHLMEMIESRESELNLLKDELAVLNKQIEQDEAIQKQLSDQINLLIEEKEDLCKKELRDQEALKVQYQKLMNERLNEEKKQFEMKLKSERTAIAHPTLNDDQRVKSPSISSRSSFDSNPTPVISSILVERLQATIRQLENQLSFYHTQLQSCNQSKDELSEEIIRMSQETEKLYKELKQRQGKEKEYEQLNERYQTLLELLGEKTEQVEELKADLGDVKDMYRTQIIELVQKIDSLSKK